MSEVADSTEARSQTLIKLFTEHSNADKMKKRRTVADSVANVGESGDRDQRDKGPEYLRECVQQRALALP